MKDQEYAETTLNTMMKKYNENMDKRDEFYAQRKQDKIKNAKLKPVDETAGASSLPDGVNNISISDGPSPWEEQRLSLDNKIEFKIEKEDK